MKKIGAFIIIILVIGTSFATFKDVPKGHWAYDAVTELTKIGILTGYPDGRFGGKDHVNRYQLAVALYRTIEYIKEIYKSPSGAVSSPSTSYSEDKYDVLSKKIAKNEINIANLEKIVSDLRRKLEDLTYKQPVQTTSSSSDNQGKLAMQLAENAAMLAKENLGKIKDLESEVSAMGNKVNGNLEKINDIRKSLTSLEEKINKLEDFKKLEMVINANKNDIDALKSEIESLRAKISDVESLSSQVNTLSNTVIALKDELADFSSMKDDINALKDKYGELSNKYVKVNEKVSELDSKVSEIDGIRSDIETLKNSLEDSNKKYQDVDKRISNVEKEIKGYKDGISNLKARVSIIENKLTKVEKNSSGSSVWLSVFALLMSIGAVAAVFILK